MRKFFTTLVPACLAAVLMASLGLAAGRAEASGPQTVYDLTRAASGQGWKAFNRSATLVEEGGRKFLRLDERAGDGEIWLDGVSFSIGTIEFNVRGKDVFQQSFVGAAFHGVDEKTFEAVYFRPFNFKAEAPAGKIHAVQYVSHPDFTWQRLRAERPDQYESAVFPVPDPNGWFHVRIVVASKRIGVYVDGASTPCLVVESLSGRSTGLVGLMVGNGSGGDYADFKITPAAADPVIPPPAAAPKAPAPMNIFQAAQAGNLARVKELVEADPAALNAKAAGGQSVLMIAIGTGKHDVAEYLIGRGADVSAENDFHIRPLHAACGSDTPVEIVRRLVEKGADVNAAAKYSGKPLDLALEVGNAGIISYLKSKGAEPTPLTFETFRLAPALHRIAYPWGMRNNVVVFSGREGILLIDSGFAKIAVPELKKTIGGLSAGNITYLINSHPHGDHIEANSVAPAEAKIVNFKNLGSPEFKDRFSRSDKPFWKDGDRELAAPYLLPFNGETIQIIPNPGLHSAEDILVYFPKSKVLSMGDLLLAGTCPAVPNSIAYLDFLDNVLAAFPDGTTFVSGHGPDLSKAGLKTYRDDLAEMIAIVRNNKEAGKSAEDMVRDDILKAYKEEYSFLDWIGPDSLIRRAAAVIK